MSRTESNWLTATVLAIAVAAGALVVWSPFQAAGALAGACLIVSATTFGSRLPQLFLRCMGILLAGYAFLGRGFAYIGVPPIYIGEAALGFGLIAVWAGGLMRLAFRSSIIWLVLLFDLWGAVRTIPYVSAYGSDALRDAVIWIYSIIGISFAACLIGCGWLPRALRQYQRWFPCFLIAVPALWWLNRFAADAIPRLPGTDVPILSFKAGDAGVHLAGIAAFLLLGLYSPFGERSGIRFRPPEWMLWGAWIIATMIVASVNRGGVLAILAALVVVLVLRPASAGRKLVVIGATTAVAATCLLALQTSDTPVGDKLEGERTISWHQISVNLSSVVGSGRDATLEGTREWRLDWWRTILGYTVFGKLFWTGKGFGVNLADEDGFQIEDHSLRSPHSGHMTILAREGVPGSVVWIMLQAAFALAMTRAYFRALRSGQHDWARVHLWILAYWLASLTNMAFDVVLEGPQGGIWFWSLFGLGIAAVQNPPAPGACDAVPNGSRA